MPSVAELLLPIASRNDKGKYLGHKLRRINIEEPTGIITWRLCALAGEKNKFIARRDAKKRQKALKSIEEPTGTCYKDWIIIVEFFIIMEA